jgi:dimethylargininase
MLVAITRAVSPAIEECELTHLAREPIDWRAAVVQHRDYERCLADLGCSVVSLAADPSLPDSVFVEDVAIVLDEVAILTRPGAPSRRPEVASVAAALARYRTLLSIEPPAILDGGDVLRVGRTLFVGRSGRTDAAGVEQLDRHVRPLGYDVRPVAVRGCLHLKSAATAVGTDTLLVDRSKIDAGAFGSLATIDIDPAEPHAANALLVEDTVIHPASCPRTRERLERHGLRVVPIDVSELAKAEGGVTCCSLIFIEAATGGSTGRERS